MLTEAGKSAFHPTEHSYAKKKNNNNKNKKKDKIFFLNLDLELFNPDRRICV